MSWRFRTAAPAPAGAGGGAGGDGDGLSWVDLLLHGQAKSFLDKRGGVLKYGGSLLKKAGGGLMWLLNPFKKISLAIAGIAAVGAGLTWLFSGSDDDEPQSHAKGFWPTG